MTATDAAAYRKAADILRTKGWCQGASEDGQGRYCLAVALRVALGAPWMYPWTDPPVLLLGELLGFENGSAVSTIVTWNDQEGRTLDEVTALLEQAAEKAEADQL